jgi:MFS family permease
VTSTGRLIILYTVLVDVLGFGIVIPILPFYVTEFGASPVTVTLLFASFSVFSFVSAPILGSLSDRIGRRPVLIASILSTAAGWFIFASAQTIPMLFLGRIIDGAAAGNFSIAQSFMVDIARSEEERTKNLGLLGALFGVGFLIGPVLGGVLSQVSHAFPFWVAGGLALLNAVSAVAFLPESHRVREAAPAAVRNPVAPLIRGFRDAALRPSYLVWTAFALAFVTGQSVFALFAHDVFGFDAFATGLLFAAIGVVVVLNQTVLLTRVWTRYFSPRRLQLFMLLILMAGLLAIGAQVLPLFAAGLVCLGTGQAVLRVIVTGEVAALGGGARRGETIGVLSALMSASMAVAPVIAGVLYEQSRPLPYLLAAGFLGVGFTVLLRLRPAPHPGTQA